MSDDAFERATNDELTAVLELDERESIRYRLAVELQQHRARIAAHAAAHPERLSEKVLDSISTTLARDTRLMIGGDMTRAEGRAAIAEIQQRRAADPTPEDVAVARDLIDWCDGCLRINHKLEAHRDIKRLLEKLISAAGVAP
ncbi:MAG TPA: hypothetical protein VFO62_10630 [Candidatus Binatia bacterium]|nr:hypothetical protein [Candidatus Binatia bacterium]